MRTFIMISWFMLNKLHISGIIRINLKHQESFRSVSLRYCGFNYSLLILDCSQKTWVSHIGDQTNLMCSETLQTLRLLYQCQSYTWKCFFFSLTDNFEYNQDLRIILRFYKLYLHPKIGDHGDNAQDLKLRLYEVVKSTLST